MRRFKFSPVLESVEDRLAPSSIVPAAGGVAATAPVTPTTVVAGTVGNGSTSDQSVSPPASGWETYLLDEPPSIMLYCDQPDYSYGYTPDVVDYLGN